MPVALKASVPLALTCRRDRLLKSLASNQSSVPPPLIGNTTAVCAGLIPLAEIQRPCNWAGARGVAVVVVVVDDVDVDVDVEVDVDVDVVGIVDVVGVGKLPPPPPSPPQALIRMAVSSGSAANELRAGKRRTDLIDSGSTSARVELPNVTGRMCMV